MKRRWALAVVAAHLALAGCASKQVAVELRTEHAVQLARAGGLIERRIHTAGFEIESFTATHTVQRNSLVIYIEGDGLAFLSPERISDDPTPLEPEALQLALASPADDSSNVVYLARPCQFTGMLGMCRADYWTNRRFAPEVIEAMDDAVSQLKARYGATRLTLVGYSGGAAIAALLAERRADVVKLISVAGNLSTRRWTELQALSPMTGSLDPYDQRNRLSGISQWHFVGSRDSVVPARLTQQFVEGLPRAEVITVEGFDHICCWAERWPSLLHSIDQKPMPPVR